MTEEQKHIGNIAETLDALTGISAAVAVLSRMFADEKLAPPSMRALVGEDLQRVVMQMEQAMPDGLRVIVAEGDFPMAFHLVFAVEDFEICTARNMSIDEAYGMALAVNSFAYMLRVQKAASCYCGTCFDNLHQHIHEVQGQTSMTREQLHENICKIRKRMGDEFKTCGEGGEVNEL